MSKKLSDKDLKDWNKFVKSKDKISPKDELNEYSINKNKSTFVIDLHGYGLDQANKFVEKTISKCFEKQFSIVNIITGKGMRSKFVEDPYKSSELSILKNSIPEFIKSNVELMKKIKSITYKKKLEMQNYLKTYKIFTHRKKLLFKIRTKMLNVGQNYGKAVLCPLCLNEKDNQSHLTKCTRIQSSLSILTSHIKMEDAFLENMDNVNELSIMMEKILQRREVLMESIRTEK